MSDFASGAYHFLKSKTGIMLILGSLVVVGLVLLGNKGGLTAVTGTPSSEESKAKDPNKQVQVSPIAAADYTTSEDAIVMPYTALDLAKVPPPPPKPTPTPPPTKDGNSSPPPPPPRDTLEIYAPPVVIPQQQPDAPEDPFARNEVRSFSEWVAPYGRKIKCELVITVDSTRIQTPVIGLVVEDVWWDNVLIIPAGTEVHGTAVNDRARSRLATNTEWVVVLPSNQEYPEELRHGAELTLRGVALARDQMHPDMENWGDIDGTFGLAGETIRSNAFSDIKLFAATALSAMMSGWKDKQVYLDVYGRPIEVEEGNMSNGMKDGIQAVMDHYIAAIRKQIEEDGYYTRVMAGAQFYLYVQQTIDLSDARVGDSELLISRQQQTKATKTGGESLLTATRPQSPIPPALQARMNEVNAKAAANTASNKKTSSQQQASQTPPYPYPPPSPYMPPVGGLPAQQVRPTTKK